MMWEKENNYLKRAFLFRSFAEAITFMTSVAGLAGTMKHHSHWESRAHSVIIRVNFQGKEGTESEEDHELCTKIDALYNNLTILH